MRIRCPFCGERDLIEFYFLGEASAWRVNAQNDAAVAPPYEAVYLRDNAAGRHRELWYHVSGCRTWLQVTRDTRTHEIFLVERAQEAAGS